MLLFISHGIGYCNPIPIRKALALEDAADDADSAAAEKAGHLRETSHHGEHTSWLTLDRAARQCGYHISGLMPASGYCFIVCGHDPEFGWPDSFADIPRSPIIYTDGAAPYVPFNLRCTNVTTKSVTIEWDVPRCNGAPIDYYEVQWQCEEQWGRWEVVATPVAPATGAPTGKR